MDAPKKLCVVEGFQSVFSSVSESPVIPESFMLPLTTTASHSTTLVGIKTDSLVLSWRTEQCGVHHMKNEGEGKHPLPVLIITAVFSGLI